MVVVVVALILAQIPGEDGPAAPSAVVEQVRQVDGVFHVDVTVRNEGDVTAAQVQIVAELVVGDTSYSGEQSIDFLSPGENDEVVFMFDHAPAEGDLHVRIASYAVP